MEAKAKKNAILLVGIMLVIATAVFVPKDYILTRAAIAVVGAVLIFLSFLIKLK